MTGAPDPRASAAAPAVPGRRAKTLALLASLALAGLVLLAWTQPWFTATLTGEASGHPPLAVAGDHAAPALAALALAALAATAALTIAGRVFRGILAVLQLLLGGCIVLSCVLALIDPIDALEPLVTAATSVAGRAAVAALLSDIAVTAWPFLALVAGGILVLVDLGILVTGRRWPGSGRRYQAVRFERTGEGASASDGAVSDWDALSDGEDPTRPG